MRAQNDSGGACGGGGFSEPARASTVPSRSTTQMRAVVRERPSMICAISGDADGGSDPPAVARSLPRSRANDAIGSGGAAKRRGRSCNAVATACAVPASVRSCASRSTRSSSRTYSTPSHGSARNTVSTSNSCARIDSAMRGSFTFLYVIPAQAGIQCLSSERHWVPAFAGTTRREYPHDAESAHSPHR